MARLKCTLSGDQLTTTLQTWLETVAAQTRIADAAAAIGVSARTLQHHLTRNGSSYRQVVDDARLTKAKRLLSETPDKITAIACEVGFSSLQHFSVWFKRRTGVRPFDYRASTFGNAVGTMNDTLMNRSLRDVGNVGVFSPLHPRGLVQLDQRAL